MLRLCAAAVPTLNACQPFRANATNGASQYEAMPVSRGTYRQCLTCAGLFSSFMQRYCCIEERRDGLLQRRFVVAPSRFGVRRVRVALLPRELLGVLGAMGFRLRPKQVV